MRAEHAESLRAISPDAGHFDKIIINTADLEPVGPVSAPSDLPIKMKDITNEVAHIVSHSRIRLGVVTIQTLHTTTALYINENEEGLVRSDIPRLLQKLCPPGEYLHDRPERLATLLNEPANAVAHLRSMLLGAGNPCVQANVAHYGLRLGTWQSILFYDFDADHRPSRTVEVLVLGVR